MPAVTYLSDEEVKRGATVEGDKDVNEWLGLLNELSGRRWVILTRDLPLKKRHWFAKRRFVRNYTLYLDCHGEWQIMNLMIGGGATNFHYGSDSRNAVINYMMGYVGGCESKTKLGASQ